MPMLTFKAIATNDLLKVSKSLLDDLQELLQCPRDAISIEVSQSMYVADGELVKGAPLVEMLWFERPEELQKKTADLLINYVQNMGYPHVKLFFELLKKISFIRCNQVN